MLAGHASPNAHSIFAHSDMTPPVPQRLSSGAARRVSLARLERQGLTGAPLYDAQPNADPATRATTLATAVVRTLGAVQSQDFAGAVWAIGMRARGHMAPDIAQAFNAGAIPRTHVLRPTWHFVASNDLRWMQRLTAPRVLAKMASANRSLGLTPAVLRKSATTIEKALAGHRYLTRTQLKAVLDRAKIHTEGTQRLAHLVMHAELDGLICSGPRMGKQFTYALLDERVSSSRDLSGDDALTELTRRYFAAHAPATVQDYAWWSGLSITECRRGIRLMGAEILTLAVDDITYFVPSDFDWPQTHTAARPAVHLLPNYDEFFIGYRDRGVIADRLGDLRLVTGANALLTHVIVIGGQLVGGWKRTLGASGPAAVPTVLVPITRAERTALDTEIERFARFSAA